MHPVAKTNFGIHGILVRYYNGTSVVNGYITKQIGTTRYQVTDGTHPATVSLAQTSAQVSALGSTQPTICTISISPVAATGQGTGAVFAATYGLDATSSVISGGSGFTVGDALVITGGVRPSGSLTIATNPQANDTVSLGGSTVTFVATGATGLEVNIGANAAATATALYTFLTGSADTNLVKCNYAVNGTVVSVISKTTGTTNNSFVLTPTSGGRITASAATLTGGAADVSVSSATATVATLTGSAAKTITITAAGTFTTLPTNPTYAYYSTGGGNGRLPIQLTAEFNLVSATVSGGTGYTTGEELNFVGIAAASIPSAHITATSGVPSAVVVDTHGSGITTKASSIGTLGPVEHVRVLYDNTTDTVEGNRYKWTAGTSVNGSAVINTYS